MILRSAILRPHLARDSFAVCSQCLSRAGRALPVRSFTGSRFQQHGAADGFSGMSTAFQKEYFFSHEPSKLKTKEGVLTSLSSTRDNHTTSIPTSETSANSISSAIVSQNTQEQPHRRRKRLKEEAKANATEEQLPPDASARLSAVSSTLPTSSLRRKVAAYLALAKPRLSVLILLSTTSAYGLYPISTLLSLDPIVQLPTLSTSTLTFLYLTAGTFMSCASANTFNMFFEPKYDALMQRTRNRPLVRRLVSSRGALIFAVLSGIVGVGLLYVGTNPTVSALSAANIILYGFVYTPMKRMHVINTWVGAIVGAIPPMMGWVAAAGQTATTGHDTWKYMLFSEESIGGWILASMLFAWQFPHFNSLSHLIKDEYKRAGHKMMCWVNPARNARVALRYSILMFPISFGFWWCGYVNNWFLVSSSLANGWMVKQAYEFWKHQGAKGSARGLFWASVWQLPIFLIGGLATKKGVWDGLWRRIVGEPDEDVDELYDDEEEESIPKSGGSVVPLPVQNKA